jgi:hypothetical protein
MKAHPGLRTTATIVAGLAVLLAVPIACGSPTDPSGSRVTGYIGDNPQLALVLPDTAHVGTALLATVTTTGSPCNRADGASLRIQGLLGEITPFDRLPPAATNCIESVVRFPRSVFLTFRMPGAATVQLHGRGPAGPLTVERTLVVLP